MHHSSNSWMARAAIVIALCLASHAVARAQFEITYGDPAAIDAAYKGVQEVVGCSPPAGIIAVGSSWTNGDADVYVVRTNNAGGVTWQNTYDINNAGRDDSATSVDQVSDGYVVVGQTDLGGGNDDIFIMKLNCDGTVAWVKTFGDQYEDHAWDVVIATSGNGTTTNAGDIVVCGYTQVSSGMIWGYLLRTSSTGAIIWDRYYTVALPHYGGRMEFHSLIQATATGGVAGGDIVAVGKTDIVGPAPPTPTKSVEAIAIRVNGNSGGFSGPLHSFAAYGGNSVDDFMGVIEHSGDIDAGGVNDLIFVGKSVFPNGATTSASEVYVVNCPGSPCATPNAEAVYGDGVPGVDWEQAHSVCEANNTGTPTAGDVVMTGYTDFPGTQDAFLLAVPAALNAAPTLAATYGGFGISQDEWGNSIFQRGAGGFLIAGRSIGLGTLGDLGEFYLIRTDGAGGSGDCSNAWNPGRTAAAYGADCYTATPVALELDDDAASGPVQLAEDPLQYCPAQLPKTRMAPSVTHGSRGNEVAHAYPNPVRRGSFVTIRRFETSPTAIRVSVANAIGEVVWTGSTNPGDDDQFVRIPTEVLSAGSYTVAIIDGRDVATRHFTVVE